MIGSFLISANSSNCPEPADVLLDKCWEHRNSKLCPASHSKSQKVAIRVCSEFLDMLAVTCGNCDDIWPLSIGNRSQIFCQFLHIIILINVKVQHSSTMHLWIFLRSRHVSIVVKNLLEIYRRPSVKLIFIYIFIYKEVLGGKILSHWLTFLTSIEGGTN